MLGEGGAAVSDEPTTICCPGEDRRTDLATACGFAVIDVHRHKGLLRGFVVEQDVKRKMHWYRNGRVSLVAKADYDLRRVG